MTRFQLLNIDDVHPASIAYGSKCIDTVLACEQFVPHLLWDGNSQELLSNEVKPVDQRQVEKRGRVRDDEVTVRILEVVVKVVARAVTFDLPVAEQLVELSVREGCEFSSLSEREDAFAVQRNR